MSRAKALSALDAELGGKGDALEPLSAAELGQLTQAVQAAKKKQSGALKDAINEGMSFVPMLLRIPLKKILFP